MLSPRGLLPLHTHVSPKVSLLTVLLRLGCLVCDLGAERLNCSDCVCAGGVWGVCRDAPEGAGSPAPLSAVLGAGCADLPLPPAAGAVQGWEL